MYGDDGDSWQLSMVQEKDYGGFPHKVHPC